MVKTSSCGCLLGTVNLCATSAFPSIFLFDYKLSKVAPSKKSVCLVVSPLVSLMVDQVLSLRSKGVHAAILSGNKGINVKLLATDKEIGDGKHSLFISAPEALACDKWEADVVGRTTVQSGGHNCHR